MFRHRLALALGRTVGELDSMAIAEFRSWIDFYEVEPWGDFRADLRAGIVAQTIVRMLGAKGTRTKPLDFMPIVQEQIARQRERNPDPTAELRAGLLAAFKGRLHHVTIHKGNRNG